MANSSSSALQGQPPPRRISGFDQFVKFVTDASGLERTFRLFQSITQILTSFEALRQAVLAASTFLIRNLAAPLLTLLLFPLFGSADKHEHTSSAILLLTSLLSVPTLSHLRASFALGRRFFRVGRFLDSFKTAWVLYTTTSSSSPSGSGSGLQTLQAHLAVLASSFNGLYLLLETLHFPEVLLSGVSGGGGVPSASAAGAKEAAALTSLWGPEIARTLHVEGQRFWLFALVCGAGAGVLKLVNLRILRAVPALGTGQNLGLVDEEEEKEKRADELKELRERRAKKEREEFARTFRKVGRRVIADLLDVALPGTVVGWVDVGGSGVVGLCMLGSTVLTGLEVWEKCGGR